MTDVADGLARLLNDAYTRGVAVIPYTDREGTDYNVEWWTEGALHSCTVEWDQGRKRWHVTDEDTPGDAKRAPSDWCAEYGIVVHRADGWGRADGWKSEGAPAWTDPITLVDFAQRIARSSVAGAQLHRLMNDATRAAQRQEARRP